MLVNQPLQLEGGQGTDKLPLIAQVACGRPARCCDRGRGAAAILLPTRALLAHPSSRTALTCLPPGTESSSWPPTAHRGTGSMPPLLALQPPPEGAHSSLQTNAPRTLLPSLLWLKLLHAPEAMSSRPTSFSRVLACPKRSVFRSFPARSSLSSLSLPAPLFSVCLCLSFSLFLLLKLPPPPLCLDPQPT